MKQVHTCVAHFDACVIVTNRKAVRTVAVLDSFHDCQRAGSRCTDWACGEHILTLAQICARGEEHLRCVHLIIFVSIPYYYEIPVQFRSSCF